MKSVWKEKVLPVFKKSKEDLLFFITFLFHSLFNVLIIIISFVLFLIFKPQINLETITLWVLATLGVDIMSSIILFLQEISEFHKDLDKDAKRLKLFISGFSKAVEYLIELDSEKVKVIRELFEEYPKDFGGVIIGADEKKYIETLKKFIGILKNSFFATLRGGYKPEYTIRWFFKDTTFQYSTFHASEKLEYLRNINNNKKINIKIRLIILSENEMVDFCIETIRNEFFSCNTNFFVFWIKPQELQNLLIRTNIQIDNREISNEYEATFIYDDYAILDETICIKHNGRNSLYIGAKDQILKMLLPFELLRLSPNYFKKLDSEGIYEWHEAEKVDWNSINFKSIDDKEGWSHIFNTKNWRLEKNWVTWKNQHCFSKEYFQAILELSDVFLEKELETLKNQNKLNDFSIYFSGYQGNIDTEKKIKIENYLLKNLSQTT